MEFFGKTVRDAGLGAAMLGAGLGLSGFGGIEQKRADAGIVISGDPLANQRAIDNGARYSVAGGLFGRCLAPIDISRPVRDRLLWIREDNAVTRD